jgi:hypothetical protein
MSEGTVSPVSHYRWLTQNYLFIIVHALIGWKLEKRKITHSTFQRSS